MTEVNHYMQYIQDVEQSKSKLQTIAESIRLSPEVDQVLLYTNALYGNLEEADFDCVIEAMSYISRKEQSEAVYKFKLGGNEMTSLMSGRFLQYILTGGGGAENSLTHGPVPPG